MGSRKIEQGAEMDAPLARHETIDSNRRMRAETRTVEVFDAGPVLEKTAWDGLITRIIRVTRSTLTRRAKDGMWDRREETSFYVCSAPLSAKKRPPRPSASHWGVENKNHYVRDVAMLEDASRIRINP